MKGDSVAIGDKIKFISDWQNFLQLSKISFRKKFNMKFENKGHYTVNNFKIKRVLGAGAFGTVFSVTNDFTNRSYAMKLLKKKAIVEKKQIRHAYMEKRVLQSLFFPFVVNLRFFFMDEVYLYYVLPLALGGEMFKTLTKLKRFGVELCRFYASQVVLALEYLHFLNLIFRDLKPENIVIFHNGYVKITDFGFCKVVTGRTYSFCGTPEYMAPELLLNKGYGKSVDWWAFGILLYEMSAGFTPFRGSNFRKIYKNILKSDLRFTENMGPNLCHLLKQLIQPDLTRRYGNLRAGVLDIKHHSWFSGFNWMAVLNQKLTPPFIPPITALGAIGSPYDPLKLKTTDRPPKYNTLFNDF